MWRLEGALRTSGRKSRGCQPLSAGIRTGAVWAVRSCGKRPLHCVMHHRWSRRGTQRFTLGHLRRRPLKFFHQPHARRKLYSISACYRHNVFHRNGMNKDMRFNRPPKYACTSGSLDLFIQILLPLTSHWLVKDGHGDNSTNRVCLPLGTPAG